MECFLETVDTIEAGVEFEQMWGNHLLGYPVLLCAVILVMCIPVLIMNKRKH